jgi:hypothetical protein
MFPFRKPERTRYAYNVNGTNVFLTHDQAVAMVQQGMSVSKIDGHNRVMFTEAAVMAGREALASLDIRVVS